MLRKLKILVVKHSLGNKYGGPAEDLERFLVSEYPDAVITVVSHPLTNWSAKESSINVFTGGELIFEKLTKRKIRGPLRHLFDVFFGPKRSDYDLVFGFNSLAMLLGVLSCKNKNAKFVAWGVDFVPLKKEPGPLDLLLHFLQSWLAKRIDVRVENTSEAMAEREKASPLAANAKSFVVPIGIWRSEFLKDSDLNSKIANKIIFLGSVNERTGIPLLLEVLDELSQLNVSFSCDIVGEGPLLAWLKSEISLRKLEEKVFTHGYLPDEPDTKSLLSKSSIGLAPFSADEGSFTFYTDPQKIRRYLSSGLVVVSSEVPPIARKLQDGSGLVSMSTSAAPKDWAKVLSSLLSNQEDLLLAQKAALRTAETFENSVLFRKLLPQIINN